MGDGGKTPLRLRFNPKIRLEFRSATITSDAGLLAFREFDDALDLTRIADDYLQESRTGRNIRHHLVPLLRQSIYSRLAGYDDTNDAERDKHIRSNDFLDAGKYPEAIFKSTGATLDDKAGTLEGNLTLHGVTRPISIQVEAIGVGNDPWGGFRRGYVGHTAIKRSDFNMNYNLGPLADEVKLRLFVEGIKNK